MGERLTEEDCRILAEVVGQTVSPNGYLAIAVERIIAARRESLAERVKALADEMGRWADGVELETSASCGRWFERRLRALLDPSETP